MKFGAHFLPTYVPELDGPLTEFYRRMFEQIEELERLGFDRAWVTEHHFGDYGGSIPHPPIWVGATRTEATFRWAGENGFNLMTIPFVHPSMAALRGLVEIYREALERAAHDSAKRQILGKFHLYVSDSLELGIREAAPYMKNYSAIHAAVDPNRKLTSRDIVSDMERGFIIVGDPQRCIDTIRRWHAEVGFTTVSFTFHFGGMPQEMALKNIRLFAERVIPALEHV